MRDPRTIILSPILTEEAVKLKDKENTYTFFVRKDANKIEIKKAIEELFKVKVVSARTYNLKGKKKRLGRYEGKRPDRKKALCRLKEGDSIELFVGL
jgi:large subunit ribosomal protein L23